jgi:hypothetical protein
MEDLQVTGPDPIFERDTTGGRPSPALIAA